MDDATVTTNIYRSERKAVFQYSDFSVLGDVDATSAAVDSPCFFSSYLVILVDHPRDGASVCWCERSAWPNMVRLRCVSRDFSKCQEASKSSYIIARKLSDRLELTRPV